MRTVYWLFRTSFRTTNDCWLVGDKRKNAQAKKKTNKRTKQNLLKKKTSSFSLVSQLRHFSLSKQMETGGRKKGKIKGTGSEEKRGKNGGKTKTQKAIDVLCWPNKLENCHGNGNAFRLLVET